MTYEIRTIASVQWRRDRDERERKNINNRRYFVYCRLIDEKCQKEEIITNRPHVFDMADMVIVLYHGDIIIIIVRLNGFEMREL